MSEVRAIGTNMRPTALTEPTETEATVPAGPPDPQAWIPDALERHERRLVRYAARITKDVERARDVVQEVFLRLCRQPRSRVAPVLAEWLFTVCRNLALDVAEKEQRMRFLEDQPARLETCAVSPPPTATEGAETREALLRLVERLPEAEQEVLRLKFEEGLSYKEIARVTRRSVSHVGVLIHGALKAIRERIPSGSDLAPDA